METKFEDETDDEPDAQYTYHYEPPEVGGEKYVRCEECGAECIPANPRLMAHKRGCSERAEWR